MKKKTKVIIIISIILILALIICGFIYKDNIMSTMQKISQPTKQEEIKKPFSYIIYDNIDSNNIKILVSIYSAEGIEYIEKPDGSKIYTNGRQEVGIDYVVEKDRNYIFKIKNNSSEEIEQTVLINDDIIKSEYINLEKITEGTGYQTIQIKNNMNSNINSNKIDIGNYKMYYKIGEKGGWQQGTNKISFLDYNMAHGGLMNEDETVTIYAKYENAVTNNTIIVSEKYKVNTASEVAAFEADSILESIERYDFGTGIYSVKVNDTTYNLKVYENEESINIANNMIIGSAEDIGTANTYAQNMVVLKVKGDITIDSGVTVTAYGTSYGGPKGMLIYATRNNNK